MPDKKITVAQIRAEGLSDRESRTWEYFPEDIQVRIFKAKDSAYVRSIQSKQSDLQFPTEKLHCTNDNFLVKNFYKYFLGQYKRMFGLEKKLADCDVAHAVELYNYYTYQAVQAKKINKNLKVVATVWENSFGRFEYNYWPGFKMPPTFWRRRIKEIMEANKVGVDKFFPVSQDAAGLLLDFGVPENKIQVITPGIIPAPSMEKVNLPPKLDGKQIYLVVNRLVKEKGVYDVLYGWKVYLSKLSDASQKVLVIVGEGSERQNMERMVGEWGLTEKIIFTGQLPNSEILNFYKAAKCLILGSIPNPTWQEQFGYVLAEAICAGVPIIATHCGAILEVVGEAGLLVPPAHPIALAGALETMDNHVVYERLKVGCEKEMKKFSAQEYARQVADVYRSLTS